jgi:hypothetical protein
MSPPTLRGRCRFIGLSVFGRGVEVEKILRRVCPGASLVLVRVMRVDRSFVGCNSRSTKLHELTLTKTAGNPSLDTVSLVGGPSISDKLVVQK